VSTAARIYHPTPNSVPSAVIGPTKNRQSGPAPTAMPKTCRVPHFAINAGKGFKLTIDY